MNNTVKIKRDNNFNFLNNKSDSRRGNKREKKPYNRKDNNKSEKI